MSLRKEMAVAVFFGLLFGGGVAFAFRVLPGQLSSEDIAGVQTTEAPRGSATPTPILEEAVSLEILLPEHQALLGEDSVTVSGKTTPQSLVAITSAADETIVIAGTDGTFSGSVSLVEGANELVVVSMSDESQLTKTVLVNYSPDAI